MGQIFGSNGNNDITGTADRDLIYGYAGDDTLDGGDGNDTLYGGAGSDSLYGGNGDDQLDGGAGADTMYGGLGNDTFYVNDIGDRVFEYANEGVDTVVSSLANYRIGANIERLTIAEGATQDNAGRSNGTGNELDNGLKGSSTANTLHGLGGNDSIYGYGGDDIIDGGVGNDVMDGGDGTDIISFKESGLAGSGANGINGAYVNLNLTNKYDTGYGLDTIRNFENIEGTIYSDILIGNGGANKISALGGGDTIRGAGGDDDITGGAGADEFLFDSTATNGVDRIRDFQQGSDLLVFRTSDGYDSSATLSYNTASGSGAQFIYNTQFQTLSYDADGAGGNAAVLIANLNENPPLTLTIGDIVFI